LWNRLWTWRQSCWIWHIDWKLLNTLFRCWSGKYTWKWWRSMLAFIRCEHRCWSLDSYPWMLGCSWWLLWVWCTQRLGSWFSLDSKLSTLWIDSWKIRKLWWWQLRWMLESNWRNCLFKRRWNCFCHRWFLWPRIICRMYLWWCKHSNCKWCLWCWEWLLPILCWWRNSFNWLDRHWRCLLYWSCLSLRSID